jgi:hypothetical protein
MREGAYASCWPVVDGDGATDGSVGLKGRGGTAVGTVVEPAGWGLSDMTAKEWEFPEEQHEENGECMNQSLR